MKQLKKLEEMNKKIGKTFEEESQIKNEKK